MMLRDTGNKEQRAQGPFRNPADRTAGQQRGHSSHLFRIHLTVLSFAFPQKDQF